MKNIHILPTEKPSRVFITKELGLEFDDQMLENTELDCQNQHIYITSDKEIKEGRLRWIVDDRNGMNGFIHQVGVILDSNVCPEIILTTDQDLIKDGVQAINDEFIEWFIKNPSCEEVEVESKITKDGVWTDLKGYVELPTTHSIIHKIIIPKKK